MSYALFDSLLEPVFVLNSDGHIIYCNEPAATICGSTPRKMVRSKQLLDQVLRFEAPLEFLSELEKLTGPTPYKEIKFTTDFYENGKAQITMQPCSFNPGGSEYLVFFRDVTLEERLQSKYRAELEQKESYIEELKSARNQLEIYSKDLESLVKKRTAEIQNLNILMKALLDSLNQAFFVFDQKGICAPVYSNACLDLLSVAPADMKVWDVLKIDTSKIEGFKNWLFTVFSELLPFDDLKPLGPNSISHAQKSISLEYFPIRNEDNSIEKIVCVGSDVTDLVTAQKQAEEDREKVQSILKMIQNRRELKMFLLETKTQVLMLDKELSKIAQNPTLARDGILRVLHTIKGGAATFSYNTLKDAAHILEEKMSPLEGRSLPTNEIQVLNRKIQNETGTIISFYKDVFGDLTPPDDETITFNPEDIKSLMHMNDADNIHRFIDERIYTQPVKALIAQFPIVIEKTAHLLNKTIAPLEIKNDFIRVPLKAFDPFFNSFIHVLRNSVDHGIEAPSIRLENAKPEQGALSLEFSLAINSDGKKLHVVYKDDGQGVNPKHIRKKLDKLNIPHSHINDAQVIYFIFNPSFSTRDDVTETSGRGVGLDAVKYEVDQLGGSIKINTQLGKFTEFVFDLPYPATATEKKQAA